jgi:tripartite ATP-independent transporter DctM subunit
MTPSFELMAPLMFAGLIVVLLIGYPVAFSLSAVGLGFGFLAIQLGYFDFVLLQALPERIFGIASNQLLLSIPFFTFMGAILERCGLAEDLLDTMGQLFGPIRGGLAYSVILVGALLGAITGTVAASVIAMGLISLPVMTRYGYDPKVATGVIAASGTITQIIPPSLVLVVLADAMGRSVGDMYAGAFIPSFILVGLFCLWIFIVGIVWPEKVPPLPKEVRTASLSVLFVRCMVSMVPSLVLIFMVLGTILVGLATPTEGGAMGAVGALALAIIHRRLTWKLLKEGMDTTLKLTTMVMFILVGSTVFSPHLSRRRWRSLDREHAVEPAGGRFRLPGIRQRVHILSGLLPRLFRDRLHHHSAACPGGGEDGDRPDLVRRAHRREHADLVHAPAVRLCAVLSALDRAALDQERRDPMGLDPLGHHHADHGGAGDPIPGNGVTQHPDLRQVLERR